MSLTKSGGITEVTERGLLPEKKETKVGREETPGLRRAF